MKPCMLAGLAILVAGPLFAQDTRGTVSGLVTDSSSAVIAGAAVKIRNVDTNVSTDIKSNEAGHYEAPLLVAGTYEVSVEAPGFRRALREGIILPAGSRIDVDLRLEIGSASESVIVTDVAPLVDSDTLKAGLTLDNKNIMELPVPGDNPMVLAMMTAGVATNNTISDYSVRLHSGGPAGVYVNGGVGGNEFYIDGTSNQSGRQMGFNPATELVQEVKIESTGYDASFGHSTGMGISLMTRSGTNQFHGSLRETYDQSQWSALDFFTKQSYYTRIASAEASGNTALAKQIQSSSPLSPFHDNQYAAAIGGPVWIPKVFNGRNKLFFFFGFAGFNINQYRQSYATFPTDTMKQGNFSQLLNINASNYQIYDPLTVQPDGSRPGHVVRTPFPGNIVPVSRIDNPVYKFYSGYLPTPNILTAANVQPTNNFDSYSASYTERYSQYTNRIDYNISSSNRLLARWNWGTWKSYNPTWQYYAPGSLADGSGQFRHDEGGGFDWVHIFGSRLILDTAAGAVYYYQNAVNPAYASNLPSSAGFPSYMDSKTSSYPLLPAMTWSGWTGFGPAINPAVTRDPAISAKTDLTIQTSRHTIRTGAEVRGQYYTAFAPGNNAGQFAFDSTYTQRADDAYQSAGSGNYGGSWAAFMLGIPTSISADTNASLAAENTFWGTYVQDNWRTTTRLSLNFGMRLEGELGGTERYNRLTGPFDPTAQLPINAGVQAAYAANPIPELPASALQILGGNTYPGTSGYPSRKVWNNSLNWMPRLAAAYQLNHTTVLRAGTGSFYDTRNVQTETLNQLGFSWPTSTSVSNDFGQTWLVGNPGAGVSPLSDPFPVRSDGSRFDTPPGSALGAMASVGRGLTFAPYDRPHARQYRWRLDVQRQFGQSMMLNFGYSGSYSNHISINQSLSAVPAQFWNFAASRNDAVANVLNANVTNPFNIANFASLKASNPLLYQYMSTNSFFTSSTIRKSALLAAFPQMNGLTETVPLGQNKTEQLDVTFTRRFSKGFNFNATYTRLMNYAADYFPNPFDTSPAFEPTNVGRPHRLMGSAIVDLPFGRGRTFLQRGIGNWIAGGWQLNLVTEYTPGALTAFTSTSFYSGANLEDICNSGPHTFNEWFNTANFQTNPTLAANTGQARVFPNYISGYGGCRGEALKRTNVAGQRNFRIREKVRLEFRWDVYNVGNHSQFSPPVTGPTSTQFGQVTSTVAGGGGTPTTNRSMRALARIVF